MPEKEDMFELCNFKSTSEEASESFPSECLGSEVGLQDGQLNGRSQKNKKGPYRKYTLEEKRMAVEFVSISSNSAQFGTGPQVGSQGIQYSQEESAALAEKWL